MKLIRQQNGQHILLRMIEEVETEQMGAVSVGRTALVISEI